MSNHGKPCQTTARIIFIYRSGSKTQRKNRSSSNSQNLNLNLHLSNFGSTTIHHDATCEAHDGINTSPSFITIPLCFRLSDFRFFINDDSDKTPIIMAEEWDNGEEEQPHDDGEEDENEEEDEEGGGETMNDGGDDAQQQQVGDDNDEHQQEEEGDGDGGGNGNDDDEEEDDILETGNDNVQIPEGVLLMRFCPHDSSMLYPKEDKRLRQLCYACRLCRYTENAANQPLIYRHEKKKEVGNILHTVPSAISDDPTLARSQKANCSNCGHYEAVFFQSDIAQSDSLALIFVCCNCDHKWVN
jgi:DNA-directed RNA polymerase II subunit RPB9